MGAPQINAAHDLALMIFIDLLRTERLERDKFLMIGRCLISVLEENVQRLVQLMSSGVCQKSVSMSVPEEADE